MEVLSELGGEIDHLLSSLISQPMVGSEQWGFTQYFFWMLIAVAVLMILVFAAVRREALVPKGRFLNGVEFIVEYARNNLVRGVIAHNADKHAPFLLTLFFFILVNNILGVIPGGKPGTGTMGVTVALAIIVFCYFVYWGFKTHGPLGYLKSIAPSGIMFPLNIFIWLLEFVSTVLRIFTLSVRLFCNLFAGHVALGALAILTSLFIQPLLEQITLGNFATSAASLGFLILLLLLYVVELLVAVIQAYVFTVLTSVYINLATSSH